MSLFIGYKEILHEESNLFITADTGHGGVICGEYQTCRNWDKNNPKTWHKMWVHDGIPFYEGLFTRGVGIACAQLWNEYKISHGFTTNTNHDLSLNSRAPVAIDFQRKHSNKKHIFLSIHGNAFSNTSVKGIEAWSDEKNNESDILNLCILEQFEESHFGNRGEKDKNFNVIYQAGKHMPSGLLELGFYSNPEEAKLMMMPDIQRDMAERITTGILKFANQMNW